MVQEPFIHDSVAKSIDNVGEYVSDISVWLVTIKMVLFCLIRLVSL